MALPTHIGKYEVDRRLGGGGMAEVFSARVVGAAGFTRPVAIKRVLPSYADDAAFAEMFVREAQLSARLNHPNIVSVVDFDRDPEQGLFLAMEMVEGRDLHQLLATGLLPISLVIHLTVEILRGLGYAHDLPIDGSDLRGLVHRDVSPHNVLLSWEGAIKVSDFGIAKARVASNASASVVIKGKPAYMSPEQVNGKPLDGRSDLFAVGIMLWEMLIGRPLFGGAGTMEEVFASLFFSPIEPPRAVRAEVPEDLSRVTMHLLQRDRDQRCLTAEDAVQALLACRNAPRDGRAELTATLETRFAGHRPERASKARAAVAVQTERPLALARKNAGRGRRLALIFTGVGVAAALATWAVVGLLVRPSAPAAVQVRASSPAAPEFKASASTDRAGAPTPSVPAAHPTPPPVPEGAGVRASRVLSSQPSSRVRATPRNTSPSIIEVKLDP